MEYNGRNKRRRESILALITRVMAALSPPPVPQHRPFFPPLIHLTQLVTNQGKRTSILAASACRDPNSPTGVGLTLRSLLSWTNPWESSLSPRDGVRSIDRFALGAKPGSTPPETDGANQVACCPSHPPQPVSASTCTPSSTHDRECRTARGNLGSSPTLAQSIHP